ncbi:MAG TPA: CPBP family intramembrane glutamic endopeptidase [Candidatus Acidoferrales bacterium]|nr:CPBP family intramembrane glutamic endopeptidase [Candidatus Acidoferrales bacterium]
MSIHKYNRPILFYSLAIAIPWAFWSVAGYVSHITPYTNRNMAIASVLGFIGLLAPMGVAYWLISKDPDLRADVSKRILNLQSIRPVYLILTLFLMLASILVSQAISLLFGYSPTQFVITGHFTFSSGIFPVWFMLIIAPIVEELGWHSYGTDCLRSRMNLFKTSLLFGVFWGVWHIPLSTIRDYYQSNLIETGWIHGVNFLVSIVPYVLLMNWLYYKTGRNILVAIVFHITAGYFNEIFATHPDSKIIQTILLSVLAVGIVLKEKDFFFQKEWTG